MTDNQNYAINTIEELSKQSELNEINIEQLLQLCADLQEATLERIFQEMRERVRNANLVDTQDVAKGVVAQLLELRTDLQEFYKERNKKDVDLPKLVGMFGADPSPAVFDSIIEKLQALTKSPKLTKDEISTLKAYLKEVPSTQKFGWALKAKTWLASIIEAGLIK